MRATAVIVAATALAAVTSLALALTHFRAYGARGWRTWQVDVSHEVILQQ